MFKKTLAINFLKTFYDIPLHKYLGIPLFPCLSQNMIYEKCYVFVMFLKSNLHLRLIMFNEEC